MKHFIVELHEFVHPSCGAVAIDIPQIYVCSSAVASKAAMNAFYITANHLESIELAYMASTPFQLPNVVSIDYPKIANVSSITILDNVRFDADEMTETVTYINLSETDLDTYLEKIHDFWINRLDKWDCYSIKSATGYTHTIVNQICDNIDLLRVLVSECIYGKNKTRDMTDLYSMFFTNI